MLGRQLQTLSNINMALFPTDESSVVNIEVTVPRDIKPFLAQGVSRRAENFMKTVIILKSMKMSVPEIIMKI